MRNNLNKLEGPWSFTLYCKVNAKLKSVLSAANARRKELLLP